MKTVAITIMALLCLVPGAYSEINPDQFEKLLGTPSFIQMNFNTPDYALSCQWENGRLFMASARITTEPSDTIVDALLAMFEDSVPWTKLTSSMECWRRDDGQYMASYMSGTLVISIGTNNPAFIRKRHNHVEQAVPGYPPQGVGSPEP